MEAFEQNVRSYTNMDTTKIKILLMAIDKGNITAAAEDLGYTASGASRAIQSLEQEIGFPLLERSRIGVSATQECRKILTI